MKYLIAVIIVFCFSVKSNAGYMVEPYIGYEFGVQAAKYKSNYTPLPSADLGATLTSPNLGLRLGYNFIGLWIAADLLMASGGKVKYDLGSLSENDFERTTIGVTGGFDFPILIRVWGGYLLKDEYRVKGTGSTEDKFSGTGYKLGVGFTGLPFLSLNLEMFIREYNDFSGTTNNRTGYKFNEAYSEAKHNTYMLSLSLPMDF